MTGVCNNPHCQNSIDDWYRGDYCPLCKSGTHKQTHEESLKHRKFLDGLRYARSDHYGGRIESETRINFTGKTGIHHCNF